MKLTTGILLMGLAAGSAFAQNPDLIENTRNTMRAVNQKKEIDSNAALAASGQATKPSAPAPAGKTSFEVTPQPSGHSPAAPVARKPFVVATKAAPAKAAPTKAAKVPQIAAKAGKDAAKKPATGAKAKAAKPKAAAEPDPKVAVEDKKNPAEPKKDKVINVTGKRDPFVSPVVARTVTGSGCSTGKRCLAIDQIALRGIVKSDNGMIAVVVNALDKAYFLRENDPVFNGYVVKITGDSIVFKETLQDKLGKSFTREVTKKINTPAV